MKYGTVLVTDDCQGVALFIPPKAEMKPKDLIFLGGAAAMMKCSGEDRDRIMAFNNYADQVFADSVTVPHWRISPICVSTKFQGKGYGSALLKKGLETVVKNDPCFLETQSKDNEGYYAKFGFTTVSDSVIPGTGIPHIAMVKA